MRAWLINRVSSWPAQPTGALAFLIAFVKAKMRRRRQFAI
jgi:hypothetical protein